MKLLFILVLIGICSACTPLNNTVQHEAGNSSQVASTTSVNPQITEVQPETTVSDGAVLLSQLLNTHRYRHQYIDSMGASHFDELSAYKELARLYAKTVDSQNKQGEMTEVNLKRMLFFSFYAKVHNNAAINEALSRDLMPIYQQNRDRFITFLAELPFLIEANCERLSANARYSENAEQLNVEFIKNNQALLLQSLKPYNTMQCLEQFK